MNRIDLKTLKLLWENWTPEDRMQWLAHVGLSGKDALRCHSLQWNRLYWSVKTKLLRQITYEAANLIGPTKPATEWKAETHYAQLGLPGPTTV